MTTISKQTADQLLCYDPSTGVLTWRKRIPSHFRDGKWTKEHACKAWNTRYAGSTAGKLDVRTGYRYVAIYGRGYSAHRLAWLITTGEWPIGEIDHINGDPTDNAIANLRVVTRAMNAHNLPMSPLNRSGRVGVDFMKTKSKWRAQITYLGKAHHLGLYSNKEDAVRARDKAERDLGFHKNHGARRRVWGSNVRQND